MLTLGIASAVIADRFLDNRIAVLGSFVGFELSRNPGIAFGLRLPPVAQEILIGIALVIVAIIAIRHARQITNHACVPERQSPRNQNSTSACRHESRITNMAFGLILGGGIANIIDRIPDGLVTDFIQIGTFPTFNVADSCITVGAVLLLLKSFRWRERKV